MTTYLVAYVGVGILVATAVCLSLGMWAAAQRLENQRASWPHREHLAELALKVNRDPEIPCVVKKAVLYLADRAFDGRFMRNIFRMPPPKNPPTFVERVLQEHGSANAALVTEALSSMAFLILLNNRGVGAKIRSEAMDADRMLSERQERIRPLRLSLAERIIADPELAPA